LTLNLTPVDQKYSEAEKRAKNDVSMNWQIFTFLDPQSYRITPKKYQKETSKKREIIMFQDICKFSRFLARRKRLKTKTKK